MGFCRRDLYCGQDNWKLDARVDHTANELYRNMACSSSGDDLLSSIGISGVLPFGGLVPCGCEHQECVNVGVLRRG